MPQFFLCSPPPAGRGNNSPDRASHTSYCRPTSCANSRPGGAAFFDPIERPKDGKIGLKHGINNCSSPSSDFRFRFPVKTGACRRITCYGRVFRTPFRLDTPSRSTRLAARTFASIVKHGVWSAEPLAAFFPATVAWGTFVRPLRGRGKREEGRRKREEGSTTRHPPPATHHQTQKGLPRGLYAATYKTADGWRL